MSSFPDIYFSGSQAQLLVNDSLLTEATSIEGVLQVGRAPVYGYASRHFDGMGTGRVLAMGSFSINYVFDGYLFAHIENTFKTKQKDLENENGSIIVPDLRYGTKSSESGKYYQDLDYIEQLQDEIFTSSDEAIKWYKEQYWNQGESIKFEEDKMRPEFLGPFKLKIRDYRVGQLKETNRYEEKIFIDVFLDKNSTVRRTAAGPTQEVYSFLAKTFV